MLPTYSLGMRASPALRMRPTPRKLANPNEEHRAHTISQRIRTLKKIPPELIPLGVVLGVAIGAAVYSMARKFAVDKQLRLVRSSRKE
ncbi:MAG: hypothetical protein M1838_002213 [Thelocarpon superellum]|nr:MAG: hypothetical protein M1838_002213 [Thelocarpon superellum]